MVTSLATARASIVTALGDIQSANLYRRRQTNYQYPCIVVGWPQSLDVRPSLGDARDFVIDVTIGVEVVDEESSDDLLSSILEETVEALLTTAAWDVQPASDFGEELLGDNRTIIWCRLPVAVFT